MRRLFDWIRQIIRWLIQWLAEHSGGGGTIADDKCCHLARKDNECHWIGTKSGYSCPQGYYKHWWYCCEGTKQLGCGECTSNPNSCWSGSFQCSIFWETGSSC